ncbi:hypothetical protein DMB42_26350 [Nonomuraea sp. WAC 01424]|uniref:hypothetical protein n=1 Tax=Nonomuraea sp. WAC 01424 TaxID=2203200 RepID=UPI000F77CC85|nr:hypothetical protein [Nonomuraea sp. WAC 01424]RSN06776.1 hypothetical protein DMB42_26350 [Nonomuraea sp. WAC 01424]
MKRAKKHGGSGTAKRKKGEDDESPQGSTKKVVKTRRQEPPSVLARLLTEVPDMAVQVVGFLSPIDIYAVRRVNKQAAGLDLVRIPPPEANIPDGQPWGQFDQEIMFWLTEVARIRPGVPPERFVWALRKLYSQGLDQMYLDRDRMEQMVVALVQKRPRYLTSTRVPAAPVGARRKIVSPLPAVPEIAKTIKQLAKLNGQQNADQIIADLDKFWKDLEDEREAIRDIERAKPENQWTTTRDPDNSEGEA